MSSPFTVVSVSMTQCSKGLSGASGTPEPKTIRDTLFTLPNSFTSTVSGKKRVDVRLTSPNTSPSAGHGTLSSPESVYAPMSTSPARTMSP